MNTTNSILHAEYFVASGYLERLIFALTELSDFHHTPSGRDLFFKAYNSYNDFFHTHFKFNKTSENIFEISKISKRIKEYNIFFERYTLLPFESDEKINSTIDFINLNYELAHLFHNYILKFTQFEIEYPRMSLIKEVELGPNEELSTSKKFSLSKQSLEELAIELGQTPDLNFLELKREEKYTHFLKLGHAKMSEKQYEQSIEAFYRAKNYKDTAEVNTLIAWCYSFKSDFNKAKNYCLKAIAIDPQYGPPYNDFGNYLLNEGSVDESFKWFELAKRAPNYQNREYPYINAGRAYMLKENYSEALREFSYALILAPYHYELHETVKKLRINLAEKRRFNTMDEHESNRI